MPCCAAKARIGKSLARSVDKGRMTAEAAAATLDRITPAGTYDAFADVDLALEAVAEDLEVKQQLFATFDKVCKPGAILATTTSSLPVVACARATSRPQDVIGMHFFNPAPAMKLVMTLLARDEADIVEAWLAFHLNAGADFVIATDNRSEDGTTEVLERYAREGHVHLIREPGEDLRQDEWVTRHCRHHLGLEGARRRQPDEHVGADDRFGQCPRPRRAREPRLVRIHLRRASFVDHALGIAHHEVFAPDA